MQDRIWSLAVGDDIVPRLSLTAVQELIRVLHNVAEAVPGYKDRLLGRTGGVAKALKQTVPEEPVYLRIPGRLFLLRRLPAQATKGVEPGAKADGKAKSETGDGGGRGGGGGLEEEAVGVDGSGDIVGTDIVGNETGMVLRASVESEGEDDTTQPDSVAVPGDTVTASGLMTDHTETASPPPPQTTAASQPSEGSSWWSSAWQQTSQSLGTLWSKSAAPEPPVDRKGDTRTVADVPSATGADTPAGTGRAVEVKAASDRTATETIEATAAAGAADMDSSSAEQGRVEVSLFEEVYGGVLGKLQDTLCSSCLSDHSPKRYFQAVRAAYMVYLDQLHEEQRRCAVPIDPRQETQAAGTSTAASVSVTDATAATEGGGGATTGSEGTAAESGTDTIAAGSEAESDTGTVAAGSDVTAAELGTGTVAAGSGVTAAESYTGTVAAKPDGTQANSP